MTAQTDLVRLDDQARAYIMASRAKSTLDVYRRDFAAFETWCADRGYAALPALPQAIALYLSDRAQSDKPATIARRMSSISQAHQSAAFDSPTRTLMVRAVASGIRRTHGVAQTKKKPVLTNDLRRMLETVSSSTLIGQRDRALLMVGFASALRRSNIVALEIAELDFTSEGVVIMVRWSKTDQEGRGRKVAIPFGRQPETCPVRALRTWIEVGKITTGPVFRAIGRGAVVSERALSPKMVAHIVKRSAEAAGLDPTKFAGHSLRAGLISQATMDGHVSERDIMEHTGHRSVTVFRGYVRDANLFRANPAGHVGL